MKKIYLSVVALGVAVSSFAQKAPTQFQKAKTVASSEVALEVPNVVPSVALAGDTINDLYYDMSEPTNWVFGNASTPEADWEFTTTGPTGDFSETSGPLESTTAANGWAMFDSDALGSNSSVHDAWIQLANPVDLTGFSSVAVAFQQYHRRFNDVVYLEASVNGTDWTSFELNPDVAGNASNDNPTSTTVNISGVAANNATVWIRFRFVGGWDYMWQVDDVAFVEGASYDLAVLDVWHGDVINDWEYQEIPLAQTQEVVVGVASYNFGGSAQTNAMYTYNIISDDDTLSNGMFAANNDSIVATDADTTWFATGFTPSELGTYEVHISVEADSTDENPGNNMGMSVFTMTENIFAHDDIENIEFQLYGGVNEADEPNEYKMGLQYNLLQPASLYAVQVAFGANTTASSCVVELYSTDNLDDALETVVYDLEPGDVSTGGSFPLVNILMDEGQGIDLDPGLYLVSIGTASAGDDLWILGSDSDDDFGGLRYGPFGAGGAIDWYTGYTTSPIVRMNFDETVGIQEENEDVSSVSVYPNPAVDNITVGFTSKDNQDLTVNVFGINGALLMSDQLKAQAGQNSRVTFDVEGLASGMYLVQIQGAKSSLTQRVIVK